MTPFVPLAVHTAGVVVVKVTARPDDAVAPTVTGDCETVRAPSGPKAIDCAARVTVKLRVTGAAAFTVSLPGWSASTVHTPAVTSAIVVPFVPPAVHTVGVVVVKMTARSAEEVAATVTGDCNTDLSASAPNVIACAAFDTPKLCDTVGAGAKIWFPGWSAATVHVPELTSVMVAPFVPPDVQTAGVVVVNDTVRPDDADAVTANDPALSARSGNAVNVMVWVALVMAKLCSTGGAGA